MFGVAQKNWNPIEKRIAFQDLWTVTNRYFLWQLCGDVWVVFVKVSSEPGACESDCFTLALVFVKE